MLPWIMYERETDPTFADCDECVARCPREVRATMHCGWLPDAEWPEFANMPIPRRFPRAGELTVCPGYSIGLPGVAETSVAHSWWRHGSLADRLAAYGEELTPALVESIDWLQRSSDELQSDILARGKR